MGVLGRFFHSNDYFMHPFPRQPYLWRLCLSNKWAVRIGSCLQLALACYSLNCPLSLKGTWKNRARAVHLFHSLFNWENCNIFKFIHCFFTFSSHPFMSEGPCLSYIHGNHLLLHWEKLFSGWNLSSGFHLTNQAGFDLWEKWCHRQHTPRPVFLCK